MFETNLNDRTFIELVDSVLDDSKSQIWLLLFRKSYWLDAKF